MKNKGYFTELFRVYSLLAGRKGSYFITIMVTCMAYPCLNVLFSFAYKNAINAIEFGESRLFFGTGILFFAAIVIQCLLEPLSNYANAVIVNKTLFDTKGKLFGHVSKLPVTYFERNTTGDITLRLSSNIDALEPIYRGNFRDIMQSLFYGIGAFVSMCVLDYRLTGVAVAFSLLAFLVNKSFTDGLKILNDEKMERASQLSHSLVVTCLSAYTAKIYGKRKQLEEQFSDQNNKFRSVSIKTLRKQIKKDTLSGVINNGANIMLLLVGLYLVHRNQTDVGTVVAVMSLQGGLTGMFVSLGGFFANMQGSLANVRRVLELYDEVEEKERYEIASANHINQDTVIALQDVNFAYEKNKKVLSDFNLQVRKNEFVAVVGENGSGKSTLIKILLGFYKADGKISFDGKAYGDYKVSEIRNKIAYVPQNQVLYDDTIFENIRCGRLDATEEEVIEAAKKVNMHDFIQSLDDGYQTVVGRDGAFLSGGQKQRIAIARALLRNANILLLDESTSALDSKNEEEVMETILKLSGECTIVMITHRLNTVKKANKIIFLQDGAIAEEGTFQTLIEKKGKFAKMYDLQSSVNGREKGE